jgi:farnesyl diphosphate synthase
LKLSDSTSVWLERSTERVDQAILRSFDELLSAASDLKTAMHYAATGDGKRVRPLLIYATASLTGKELDQVAGIDACAVAVELFHTYSLVHDDLPCMDNDDLRRGKPTVHRQYDEATALLVGDALQSQAFLILSEGALASDRKVAMLSQLAQAAGSCGMCGGQAIDLDSVGVALALAELEQMHRMKTGALLRASVLLGALAGKSLQASEQAALDAYADAIGLAFQVVDDILDATADSATLGKTAGKDAAQNKPTYVSILGLAPSLALADKLRQDAHHALQPFGEAAVRLRELADLIVQRKA